LSSSTTTSRAPWPSGIGASALFHSGRVKAAMMSASAAHRSSSRNQCWMRRRREAWYGIFRTNISDGK
jgi:hypothetical protein